MPKDDPKPIPVDGPGRADPGPNHVPASPITLRGFEMIRAEDDLGGPDPKATAQDGLPAPDSGASFVNRQPGGGMETGLTAETSPEQGRATCERPVARVAHPFHARGAIALCLTVIVLLVPALVFRLIPALRSGTQRPAALTSPTALPAVLSAPLASAAETQNPFAAPARIVANTSEAMTSEAVVARHAPVAQLASRRTQSSCIAAVPRDAASVAKADTWSMTKPCAARANDIDMDDFTQHFSTKRLEPPP